MLANVRLDEVLDAIEDEFKGIAKAKTSAKGRKCTYEFKKIFNSKDGEGSRQSGVKFIHHEKGIEVDIDFVSYQKPVRTQKSKSKKRKEDSSDLPEVSLRFTLRKGLLFKLYNYILVIDSLLKSQRFTFYK